MFGQRNFAHRDAIPQFSNHLRAGHIAHEPHDIPGNPLGDQQRRQGKHRVTSKARAFIRDLIRRPAGTR